MAAIDFPVPAAVGEVFSVGGTIYTWNGTGWTVGVGDSSAHHVTDVPPSSPANGDLWFESDTGITWIWYEDPTAPGQWVQVSGGGGGGGTPVDAYTKAESDAKYVELTGDDMSGNLLISTPAGPALGLNKLEGTAAVIDSAVPGKGMRWRIALGDSIAESGGNAGSEFRIDRFDDAGAMLGTTMKTFRASGETIFYANVSIEGAVEPSLILRKTAQASVSLWGQNGNSNRWRMSLGNATSEVGTNTGSNFQLDRFDDNGGSLSSAMLIHRDTGKSEFTADMTIVAPSVSLHLRNAAGPNGSNIYFGEQSGVDHWRLAAYPASMDLEAFSGAALASVPFRITKDGVVDLQSATIRANGQFTMVNGDIVNTIGRYYYVYTMGGTNFAAMSADGSGSIYFATGNAGPLTRLTIGNNGALSNGSDETYKPGGGQWLASSDARIKTVHGDYTAGLAQILAINPVRYSYKGNDTILEPADPIPRDAGDELPIEVPYPNSMHYTSAKSAKEFIGLVAQDVEAVMPEMVQQIAGYIDGAPVTDLRTIDGNALTYALINAVKELAATNEALKARLDALEVATPQRKA